MTVEKWLILMRISTEIGNVDEEENHSYKDKGSVEDVNISVVH